MPESILDWGLQVVLSIQANFPGLTGIMQFFTALGFAYSGDNDQ